MTRRPRAADPSDEALMHRIQRDDVDALGELFDRYARDAYGLAISLCRRPEIAEAVVQDAFVSIWRSRSGYRPMGANVGAWVRTMVRHRAIDALRHKHVHDRWHDDGEAADEQAAPGAIAADAEEARRLRQSLAALPEAQRDVIALASYGELSHAEISAYLDLPLGTVKGRMRQGLIKLRAA
ncbi:sigma-70 family RNA polymerase sigma factor [Solirubrobacter taibaiensis]|nr:sigma-70 family RNA polymerase sigma factor [Solirubrobacter taibaiensis]